MNQPKTTHKKDYSFCADMDPCCVMNIKSWIKTVSRNQDLADENIVLSSVHLKDDVERQTITLIVLPQLIAANKGPLIISKPINQISFQDILFHFSSINSPYKSSRNFVN